MASYFHQPLIVAAASALALGLAASATGKELWKYNCGAGVNAPAMSYVVGGKQHVAVAAGGNNQIDAKRGNSVFVFAIP